MVSHQNKVPFLLEFHYPTSIPNLKGIHHGDKRYYATLSSGRTAAPINSSRVGVMSSCTSLLYVENNQGRHWVMTLVDHALSNWYVHIAHYFMDDMGYFDSSPLHTFYAKLSIDLPQNFNLDLCVAINVKPLLVKIHTAVLVLWSVGNACVKFENTPVTTRTFTQLSLAHSNTVKSTATISGQHTGREWSYRHTAGTPLISLFILGQRHLYRTKRIVCSQPWCGGPLILQTIISHSEWVLPISRQYSISSHSIFCSHCFSSSKTNMASAVRFSAEGGCPLCQNWWIGSTDCKAAKSTFWHPRHHRYQRYQDIILMFNRCITASMKNCPSKYYFFNWVWKSNCHNKHIQVHSGCHFLSNPGFFL